MVDNLSLQLNKLGFEDKYEIFVTCLNYYKDGTHYTPSHSHKGMTQLIISLEATRTLHVGSKDYRLNNEDVIIFGSSAHSIPIDSSLLNTNTLVDIVGWISIATIMQPYTSTVNRNISYFLFMRLVFDMRNKFISKRKV